MRSSDANTVNISGVTAPSDVLLVSYLSGDGNLSGMVNPVTKFSVLGSIEMGAGSFEAVCEATCAVIVQDKNHGSVSATYRLTAR